jgi:drug/metabolite transporter (DMT)-like permease
MSEFGIHFRFAPPDRSGYRTGAGGNQSDDRRVCREAARSFALRTIARTVRGPLKSFVSSVRSPRARDRSIRPKPRVALALGLNQLLSSGTHLIAKGALTAIGPLSVALLRFSTASLVLLLERRLRGRSLSVERRHVPRLLLLGFLVVPINQGWFLFGLARSTPSHASFLYALTPLVVLLLARRMLGERAVWSKLAGMAVAFSGAAIILLERGLKREGEVLAGDLLILGAVCAWALYTVLSKPLVERYDAMSVTTWAIVSGTVFSLPALAIPGAIPPLRAIRPEVWGGILYLAIATSVIAYPLWLYALKHLDASKVAITTNLQPILTATLSWIIFHERFTRGFLIGASLILGGVTWVETRRTVPRRRTLPSEPALAAEREGP